MDYTGVIFPQSLLTTSWQHSAVRKLKPVTILSIASFSSSLRSKNQGAKVWGLRFGFQGFGFKV